MKEVADALSFLSTDVGAFRFFALLFPGFIALAMYDLRVPGERRKWSDMGVALVAYSILIDVFAASYLKFSHWTGRRFGKPSPLWLRPH